MVGNRERASPQYLLQQHNAQQFVARNSSRRTFGLRQWALGPLRQRRFSGRLRCCHQCQSAHLASSRLRVHGRGRCIDLSTAPDGRGHHPGAIRVSTIKAVSVSVFIFRVSKLSASSCCKRTFFVVSPNILPQDDILIKKIKKISALLVRALYSV